MRLTCTCVCTLALTCLLAACALPPEPKGILVEEDSVKPKREKSEAAPAQAQVEPVFLPVGKRASVMKINPEIYTRLPDRKDMQATAPTNAPADRGGNLMVPAPKPVNE